MNHEYLPTLNGVFAVRKPPGISSAAAVSQVKNHIINSSCLKDKQRSLLFKKLKVGHGGTLDPMASGVLVIGLGEGCKKLAAYLSGSKIYKATAIFGLHYDTLDITGKLLFTDSKIKLDCDSLVAACGKWTGNIMQRPPAFSAIHIKGERAYNIARELSKELCTNRNESTSESLELIEIPARPVFVQEIKILNTEENIAEFEMHVGGGVYVRSLIRDIAADIGTVGVMSNLTRTCQGIFRLESDLVIQIDECKNIEIVKSVMENAEKTLKRLGNLQT